MHAEWNPPGTRGVQIGMDETTAWDLALWQLEMDQHYREQGIDPP